MKKHRGVTLIKVIVPIVIVGILAAIALPKIANLGGDAHFAMLKNAERSMRAANSLIYARATTLGVQNAAKGVIPANTMGNASAINVEFGYAATVADLTALMDLSPVADFIIGATTLQLAKANAPEACLITYTKATATTKPLYVNNGNPANCS
jgi:MSHA pilin protein MshA